MADLDAIRNVAPLPPTPPQPDPPKPKQESTAKKEGEVVEISAGARQLAQRTTEREQAENPRKPD